MLQNYRNVFDTNCDVTKENGEIRGYAHLTDRTSDK